MKSKQQKQAEAIERKKRSIPAAIERLEWLSRELRQNPGSGALLERAKGAEVALARLYEEVGFSREAAQGAARAVATGRPAQSWLSGVETGSEMIARESKEPSSVAEAVQRTQKVVRGVRAVCLVPHPFRRAIQIRADGPREDGSLIANMEILELDRLASAFRNEGVRVFRTEAAYMEYQAGRQSLSSDAVLGEDLAAQA